MTLNVFKTESRRAGRFVLWMSVGTAAYLAVAFIAASFLPDGARLAAAENAYWFLLIVSYVAPPLLIFTVIYGERFRYYEAAGVKRAAMTAGRVLTVFVWVTAFLLVELLAATVFDGLLFAGKTAVRNQLRQQYFLFSLVSHGAGRLLFAPSVGVAAIVAYLTYGALKRSIVTPRSIPGKALGAAIVCVVFYIVQVVAAKYWLRLTLESDLNFYPMFDTLIPIQGLLNKASAQPMPVDAVRDYHYYAAPILNILYLLPQAVYVMTAWAYIVLGGKRDV